MASRGLGVCEMWMLRSLAVVVALISLTSCGSKNPFTGVSDGQVFQIETFPGFTVTSQDNTTPITIQGAELLSNRGISCYSQSYGTATCTRGYGGQTGGQYYPQGGQAYNPGYNPGYNTGYNPGYSQGGTCSRSAPCTVTFTQGGGSVRVVFQSQY